MTKYDDINDLDELTNLIVQDWDTDNIIKFSKNKCLSKDNLDWITIEMVERSNQYNYYYLCKFVDETPNLSLNNINMIINRLLEILESINYSYFMRKSKNVSNKCLDIMYLNEKISTLIELTKNETEIVKVKKKDKNCN